VKATRLGTGFAVAVRRVRLRAAVLVVVMLTVFCMAPHAAGAAAAARWRNGQVITFTPGDWGGRTGCCVASTALGLLFATFDTLYIGSSVEIGLPGTAGFSDRFFDALSVNLYLGSFGAPAALSADRIDPALDEDGSGMFGTNVLALKLNVDFTDAGLIVGALPLRFGDLRLCNLGQIGQLGGTALLNGLSVRQVLAIANTLLGGGTVGGGVTALTIADAAVVIEGLNSSFGGGLVTEFAQEHLCR